MKLKFKGVLAILFLAAAVHAQTNAPVEPGAEVETIVCIRHAEKPKGGLGQLSCHGLNRSLALPKVLLEKYGKPAFIFAPNPSQKIDSGLSYYYLRPLATIEPTAIRCGMPVNTKFGFTQISGLRKELRKPAYHNAVVFMAWEHVLLDEFAKEMVKSFGADPAQVPAWPGSDFDSIFVIKITRTGNHASVSFTVDHQGLNHLSNDCPGE